MRCYFLMYVYICNTARRNVNTAATLLAIGAGGAIAIYDPGRVCIDSSWMN